MSAAQTRVTVLTPPGTGAIATIAVSGPQAWELARQLFQPAGKPLPQAPEILRFWFGRIGEGAGDEVILAAVAPNTIEVHCHGGRRVVRWLVEQFLARGCVDVGRAVPDTASHVGQSTARGCVDVGRAVPDTASHVGQFTARGCVDVGRAVPDTASHVGQSTARGCVDVGRAVPDTASHVGHSPTYELQHALTLRTAAILLDQHHGAFEREVERILASPTLAGLDELARYAPVGRHLVAPWRVVVAGEPNVGKSSLVNALAGFQRAVVAETAGTTLDLVSVQLAFDGWPVEVTDTAGLREAAGLEAEGIARAEKALADADLVLWVIDGSVAHQGADARRSPGSLLVINKCDLPLAVDTGNAICVSATAGLGIAELIAAIVARLIPVAPAPGAAVPFTPALADRVELAARTLVAARPDDAARILRDCLPTG